MPPSADAVKFILFPKYNALADSDKLTIIIGVGLIDFVGEGEGGTIVVSITISPQLPGELPSASTGNLRATPDFESLTQA